MRMREPTAAVERELIVRRSRFIARAEHAASVDAANRAIGAVRTKHPGATHVVFAYLIGPSQSETAGLSDAGEPKGTAGRPVMAVLRGSDVTDCVVTVVRFFGGTKLGTGGLVRAYTEAARLVLSAVPTRIRVTRVQFSVSVPYSTLEPVRSLLEKFGAEIRNEAYGSEVGLAGELTAADADTAAAAIRDLTAGTVEIRYTS